MSPAPYNVHILRSVLSVSSQPPCAADEVLSIL
jgi:hypothetical protein